MFFVLSIQGDLSGIRYADGREVKLSYNPLRQLLEVRDWLGNTKITPDALGRLSEIQKDGQMQTRYGYDAFGNRTWKEESGAWKKQYVYGAINRLEEATSIMGWDTG